MRAELVPRFAELFAGAQSCLRFLRPLRGLGIRSLHFFPRLAPWGYHLLPAKAGLKRGYTRDAVAFFATFLAVFGPPRYKNERNPTAIPGRCGGRGLAAVDRGP